MISGLTYIIVANILNEPINASLVTYLATLEIGFFICLSLIHNYKGY